MEFSTWYCRLASHLDFLYRVSQHELHFDPQYLRDIVELYRKLVPLIHVHGASKIWLPLSVLWIFHCHLLHPISYMNDCSHSFGRIVPFNARADEIDPSFTKEVFRERYGYELEDQVMDASDLNAFKPSIDLVDVAVRQEKFVLESQEFQYNLDEETTLQNYLDFINNATISNTIITPSKSVLFTWHTHMLYPEEYIRFTLEKLGTVLDNVDSEDEDLEDDFKSSVELLQRLYGESELPTESKCKSINNCMCSTYDTHRIIQSAWYNNYD
jgi:hypothetical protein